MVNILEKIKNLFSCWKKKPAVPAGAEEAAPPPEEPKAQEKPEEQK